MTFKAPQAERVRAFFADVLGLPSADAGGGWLIFALPPQGWGLLAAIRLPDGSEFPIYQPRHPQPPRP